MVLRNISLLCCLMLASTAVHAEAFKLVSRDGRQAEYAGSLSLSGRFERRQDAETLDWRGDRVCFFPEAAAASQLPSEAAARGNARFCFSNHRAATDQLRLVAQPAVGSCGVTGTATVSISRYVVESGDGDIFDQAWLDKVLQQGPVSPLRCN